MSQFVGTALEQHGKPRYYTSARSNDEKSSESDTDLPKLRSVAPPGRLIGCWVPLTWCPGQCCFGHNVIFIV